MTPLLRILGALAVAGLIALGFWAESQVQTPPHIAHEMNQGGRP